MNRPGLLWLGFGTLWLIDGLLQAQPTMFTQQFVTTVLKPVAQGQPDWLAGPLAASTLLWQTNPEAANLAATVVQLAIGVVFLLGRERLGGRIGLVFSMGWGLIVWTFGEGFGGLLTGQSSALTGAPGSVLVYVAGAALLLISRDAWHRGTPVRWTRRLLGGYWLLAALIQALPTAGYWTAMGLGMLFQGPPIAALAALAARDPVVLNAVFVTVMISLGLAFLFDRIPTWVYVLSFGWLGFTWWLGQDFGALLSGTGTDPNTALPLALLTLATVPRLPRWLTDLAFSDIRQLFTVPRMSGNVGPTSEAAPHPVSGRF